MSNSCLVCAKVSGTNFGGMPAGQAASELWWISHQHLPLRPSHPSQQWFSWFGLRRSTNNARTHTRVILYCTLTLFSLFATLVSLFVTLFTLPPTRRIPALPTLNDHFGDSSPLPPVAMSINSLLGGSLFIVRCPVLGVPIGLCPHGVAFAISCRVYLSILPACHAGLHCRLC